MMKNIQWCFLGPANTYSRFWSLSGSSVLSSVWCFLSTPYLGKTRILDDVQKEGHLSVYFYKYTVQVYSSLEAAHRNLQWYKNGTKRIYTPWI